MWPGVKVGQESLLWFSNPNGACVHPGSSPNYLLFLANVYLLDWVSSFVQNYTAERLPVNTSCGPKWMAFWDEKWGSWQPDTTLALGPGESAPWAYSAGKWDFRVHLPNTLLWLCFFLESRAVHDLVSTAAPATIRLDQVRNLHISHWQARIVGMIHELEKWGMRLLLIHSSLSSSSGILGCWLPSRSHHWLWQRI